MARETISNPTPYMPADLAELAPDAVTKPYWDHCNQGELRIQRCKACGTFRHPPLPGCPECAARDDEWVRSEGKGQVFSFSGVYHPVLPNVAEYVPYNVVLVQLADVGGVRIISNLLGVALADIEIGMPVELVWERVSPDVNLPRFRPAEG